ncbi:hypothetical protein K438DRAFT_1501080, partial [Mycena galopus ATCC 62051]
HRVAIEQIRQSLLRIDPVWRIFERICIHRRDYRVLGPNSLWHHDGQHAEFFLSFSILIFSCLIHWGIVIHGFIDGY